MTNHDLKGVVFVVWLVALVWVFREVMRRTPAPPPRRSPYGRGWEEGDEWVWLFWVVLFGGFGLVLWVSANTR